MSEQVIDLRSTWAILRRRGGVLVLAASVGALCGGAALYLRPPVYSSTSIVLLPAVTQGSSAAATAHSIDTQVQIAKSEAVLGPAGKAVSPPLQASQVAGRVDVEAPTTDVLDITATGPTPEQAQALSESVANSEIDFLEAAASSLGRDAQNALSARSATLKDSLAAVNAEIKKAQDRISKERAASAAGKADAAALAELTAQQANIVLQLDQIQKQTADASNGQQGADATIIQQASPAARTPVALRLAIFGTIGALAALLLAAFVIVLPGRRERTMRSRDEIADAIGIPVAASIQGRAPRSVAAWTALLESYAPNSVEMWTLRQLLRLVTPGHPGSLANEPREPLVSPSVVLLTLSDDLRALAVGPQLASFAASTGMPTRLLTAQPHDSANALWAACAGLPADARPRPGLAVNGPVHRGHPVELLIHVAVIDRAKPLLDVRGADDAVTLLAVTSGAATADELARVALAADDAGHPIARIVIVDPDPLDRTTGRLLASERTHQVPLPSLMTGSAIAADATTLETRRRLR